jgi:hypothetical protein
VKHIALELPQPFEGDHGQRKVPEQHLRLLVVAAAANAGPLI